MKTGNEQIGISPPNVGWIQGKLNDEQMDYVWKCIENKGRDVKNTLAGQIDSSYALPDTNDWFFENVVSEYVNVYHRSFGRDSLSIPTTLSHNLILNYWWVNYQKEGEYNPPHNHSGIYSFVIWMKIPTRYEEQNELKNSKGSNMGYNSTFQFRYNNLLGEPKGHKYKLTPEDEGTMLLFPSKLEHAVYPFYNCKEDRISVSGNIFLDTSKRL